MRRTEPDGQAACVCGRGPARAVKYRQVSQDDDLPSVVSGLGPRRRIKTRARRPVGSGTSISALRGLVNPCDTVARSLWAPRLPRAADVSKDSLTAEHVSIPTVSWARRTQLSPRCRAVRTTSWPDTPSARTRSIAAPSATSAAPASIRPPDNAFDATAFIHYKSTPGRGEERRRTRPHTWSQLPSARECSPRTRTGVRFLATRRAIMVAI